MTVHRAWNYANFVPYAAISASIGRDTVSAICLENQESTSVSEFEAMLVFVNVCLVKAFERSQVFDRSVRGRVYRGECGCRLEIVCV